MSKISNLVYELSKDPFNPDINFDVAEEYLANNQTASAVSFYLRCAEYSSDTTDLAYASLLRMAQCFDDQRGREYSVTNCLLQAVALDDTRPEGYWALSVFHEKAGNWQECYTFATIGLGWVHTADPLPADIGYQGEVSILFQLAVAAWWIGRKDESLSRFLELQKMVLPDHIRVAVVSNLERINAKSN